MQSSLPSYLPLSSFFSIPPPYVASDKHVYSIGTFFLRSKQVKAAEYRAFQGFSGSSVVESACKAGAAGDTGSVSGWKRPLRRGDGNPLQYSCLENPHGQRSVCKESDTTERLSTHAHIVHFRATRGNYAMNKTCLNTYLLSAAMSS